MDPSPLFRAFLDAAREHAPEVSVILGSGMGDLADRLEDAHVLPFTEIPDLAGTSVHGHRGQLLLGRWAGRRALVFAGRLHYYEGHAWERVLAPVHLAHALGARTLILTNAAGGIRADLRAGDLVALNDHVEWTRPYCWRHPGTGGLGPARPSPYDAVLTETLTAAALREGFELTTGVYGQVTGPSYETPAEIRALRACAVDVVGMSTAREAQAGHDLGMRVVAVSSVCNQAAGLSGAPISHEEVLQTAAHLRQRLTGLIEGFLSSLQ